jgi:hypothetical protein
MDKKYIYRILFGISLLLLGLACENNIKPAYNSPPQFEKEISAYFDSLSLKPVRINLLNDTLFVSYAKETRIDLFTSNFDYIKSVYLNDPEPVFPTNFVVDDSLIIVADHAKGALVIFDKGGRFLDSFGLLPDQHTRLSPFGLTYHRGVIYSGDAALRQVMVISYSDAPGVTEKGELILSFPRDSTNYLGFPSALFVTYDGRLLVGDAVKSKISAFTCDGRYIYDFDSLPAYNNMAPLGIAMDRLIDPSIQDTSSFDPSGIRIMGRFHIADGNNNVIHMFNPLGKYIGSYPDDHRLIKPSGLAYDTKRKLIYIADPGAGKIFVYRMIE